jgi:aminomethyltransferase
VRCFGAAADSSAPLLRTALYEEHVKLGGKMVPFAGYALPVQYKDSLINSHMHCRTGASLFDVSHMGQLRIWGEKRVEFLESVVVGDLQSLNVNQMRLSVLTTELGGIIDDCMITRKQDHIYMVINAGCKEKDIKHLNAKLAEFNKANNADVRIEEFSREWELVALQGPKAAEALSKHLAKDVDLSKLPFLYSINIDVAGVNCIVSRCGYTGEDGFEISIPKAHTATIFQTLLSDPTVLPAALGVRDSLRLEAGLCLYGHDLNDTITPIEANLNWLISKRRREAGGFPGAAVIQKQLKEGVTKKRVGLNILSGAPAREEAIVQDLEGNKVGVVTSGSPSPVLKRSIAMAYVDTKFAPIGTKLKVIVRGKAGDAEVTKMPFVPTKYYKP